MTSSLCTCSWAHRNNLLVDILFKMSEICISNPHIPALMLVIITFVYTALKFVFSAHKSRYKWKVRAVLVRAAGDRASRADGVRRPGAAQGVTVQSATKIITVLNQRKCLLWGLRPQERSLKNPKSFLVSTPMPLTAGKRKESLTVPGSGLEEARSICHKPRVKPDEWQTFQSWWKQTAAHLHEKRQKFLILLRNPTSTNSILSTSSWAYTAFCRAPMDYAEPARLSFIFLCVRVCGSM